MKEMIMKKITTLSLLILFIALLGACSGVEPRPELRSDLDKLKWGTRYQKKIVITMAYRQKNPDTLMQLLSETARDVWKKRLKPDTYYYDNRSEVLWTCRFVMNVLAKIKNKKAFPAVLAIAGSSWFKDSDNLAATLEKVMKKLGGPSQIDAMIKTGSGKDIAPSHQGALLNAAGVMIVKSRRRLPKELEDILNTLIKSTDPARLKNGLSLVGILKYKKAEKILLGNIDSSDINVKKESCMALVLLGNKKGALPLLEMNKNNAAVLLNISRKIEAAGFATIVRQFYSDLETAKYKKQAGYLINKGALKNH